jgi:hypothetical protein
MTAQTDNSATVAKMTFSDPHGLPANNLIMNIGVTGPDWHPRAITSEKAGDELFNAIIKKYDGDIYSMMIGELMENGLVSVMEASAFSIVEGVITSILSAKAERKAKEEQGEDFDFDEFITSIRFSIIDIHNFTENIYEPDEYDEFSDFEDLLNQMSVFPVVAEHREFIESFPGRIKNALAGGGI